MQYTLYIFIDGHWRQIPWAPGSPNWHSTQSGAIARADSLNQPVIVEDEVGKEVYRNRDAIHIGRKT